MLHPLQRQLAALRTNAIRLLAVFGLGRALATALAGMMILGFVDYLIRYQDLGLRVLSSLILLGLLLWISDRYIYRLLIHRLSDAELARRVGRCHPQLGDSLLSAVEFLGQQADDPTAGSAALRRAVIAETAARSAALDFSAVLDRRPSFHAALATLLVGLLASVLIVLDPPACRVAVARLVNPFGSAAWPRATHLKLTRSVDGVARGQSWEIEVIDAQGAKLPAEVRIHYRAAGAKRPALEETERMHFLAGAMMARRENVTQPFFFRVEGGDDQSMPWTRVEVVEPPLVQSLRVRLEPPPYTFWPPYDGDCQIRALRGTRIHFQGESNRPLKSAVLSFQDGRRVVAALDGQRRFHVPREGEPLLVDRSQSYGFTLTDRDSGISQDSDRWEIHAVPDNPPSVSIEQPSADVYVTPKASLSLRILAKDDLAIQEVALRFGRSDRAAAGESRRTIYRGPARENRPVFSSPVPAFATMAGESRTIDYVWDLASLDLGPGTEVTYCATAADYRPGVGCSDVRRLRVITVEDLQNRIAGRESLILAELAQVLKLQQDNRAQVASPAARFAASGVLEQSDVDHLQGAALNQRQIDRVLSGRGEGVVRHIGNLLDDLDRNKVDSPEVRRRVQALLAEITRLEKEQLPSIAEELTTAIKAAQVALEDRHAAADRKSPDPLVTAALAGAVKRQDQVIAALSLILGRLSQWDDYRRFYRDVAEMVRQQEELARRALATAQSTLAQDAKDLRPEQVADLGSAARGELELALRLEQLQESLRQANRQMADSDPAAAATVADAAAEIDRRGTSAAMRAAADNLRRNQIGQAIQGQKQILQDLDQVLDVLAGRRPHEPTARQKVAGRGGQGSGARPLAEKQLTLADLKLVKSLQQEINRRTRQLDATHESSRPADAAVRQEYGDLERDQGNLADRVGRFSDLLAEPPPGGHPSLAGKTDGAPRPPAETSERSPTPPTSPPADPLDRSLFEPDAEPASRLPQAGQSQPGRLDADALSRQPMRQLGPADAAEEENPLAAVARAMRDVQGRIARTESGPPTQALEERIVADLDRLIGQSRTLDSQSQTQPQTTLSEGGSTARPPQAQSGQPKSASPRGGSAGRQASTGQSPSTAGAAKVRGMMENVWGELPARQRQQMLQSPAEEFLPEYESMLEDYFRRLAAPQEKRP